MFGKLVRVGDPGRGRAPQNWLKSLEDDFKSFGATDGSTDDRRLTFGIDTALWTTAAEEKNGVPWYAGVMKGAARFMTAWHKEEGLGRRRQAGNAQESERRENSAQQARRKPKRRRRRGRGKLEEASVERPERMRRRRQMRARGN
ncbi:unnamed protein product [Pylaiella littoralis]